MSDLTVSRAGRVAILEVHRPPANFFDEALLNAIADEGGRLQSGDGVRAVVLCSEGKHFCAGADFGSNNLDTVEGRSTTAAGVYRAGIRLFELELPIVAAVQGSAVGGGLGLACATDFRIASPQTRFHANFASLGFHHGFGLTVTLPRIVGHQRALDIMASSRRVDGTEAAALGLVDRLCEPGEERRTAVEFADHLATMAPLALRAIKRTLRASIAKDVRAALEHELAEQRRLWVTEDSKIGIEASLKRSTPEFVGR